MIGQVYRMIPTSDAVAWILGAIALLLVGVACLVGYTAFSTRQVRFEVSQLGVEITGPHGELIPAKSLQVAYATALDLTESHEFRPQWRTRGIGLPGYKAGWYRLRNGERALVFVTDPRRVMYVPTTEGYSLLLSIAEADMFLRSLANAMSSP